MMLPARGRSLGLAGRAHRVLPRDAVHNVVGRSKREGAMRKFWVALALAGAGFGAGGDAEGQPGKIAHIQKLSGRAAAGRQMLPTANKYRVHQPNTQDALARRLQGPEDRKPGR